MILASSNVSGFMVGGQTASGIYLGSTKVWQSFDPDALAYIAAIEAQGATVTGAQKTAISDFVAAEKAASRWTGLKRFYLPVWGIAAANAICMKSLTSGTFSGGVTHAAGYVEYNGTSGSFNANATAIFSDADNANYGFLAKTPSTIAFSSYADFSDAASICAASDPSTDILLGINTNDFGLLVSSPFAGGIVACDITSGPARKYYIRTNAGGNQVGTDNTALYSSTAAAAFPQLIASSVSVVSASDYQMGALWAATSYTNELPAFTLNIKTLWETVTNLTLP